MKTTWLIFAFLTSLLASHTPSWAQIDSTATVLLRKSLWRVGLVNFVKPTLSHELRLAPTLSLMTGLGLRTDNNQQGGNNRPTLSYRSLVAEATVGLRCYYNLAYRARLGKDIRYNSGNYLSVTGHYISPILAGWGDQTYYETIYPKGFGNTLNVRLLWGHQRRFPSTRLYYDLSGGCQLYSHKGEGGLYSSFIAQAAIGYSFPK